MSKQPFPKIHPYQLWKLTQVEQETGLRRTSIYTMAAASEFPKPIKIGKRASAWVACEVVAWIEARIAERDALPHGYDALPPEFKKDTPGLLLD